VTLDLKYAPQSAIPSSTLLSPTLAMFAAQEVSSQVAVSANLLPSPPTRSWSSAVPAFAVRPRTAWRRLQHGLKARNLSGGFLLRAIRRIPANCFGALDQR